MAGLGMNGMVIAMRIALMTVGVDGAGCRPRRPDSGRVLSGRKRTVSAHAGDGADSRGECRNVVEHAECDEVVGPAGIVLSALAGPDQDAMTRGHSELPDLNICPVMVQGDFAGDGDTRSVRAKVKTARRQGKFGGKLLQPRAGCRVKTSLLLLVVGAASVPVEHVDLHKTEQARRSLARCRACSRLLYAVKWSGGRAALDDVGSDLIGCDLFEIGPTVRIGGEPAFGRLAIPGEMQEFRAVAEVL